MVTKGEPRFAWVAPQSKADGKGSKLKSGPTKLGANGPPGHSDLSEGRATDAKVTCDGNVCKATDLKAGTKIRVTTKSDDKKVATHVEAIDKDANFAHTHDGKFVSIIGHKLTMTDSTGKEHSHRLSKDATMTCDGGVCKVEQLKTGMKIRVTTEKSDAGVATHVEAIDKDTEFSQGI